jgi:hypothetical protein
MKSNRFSVLVVSICLVLTVVVTLSGGLLPVTADKPLDEPAPGLEKRVETVEPEISFDDGVPLFPNIEPVIIVSGSDYDIGYQWSQQLIQIFGSWFLEDWQHDFTDEEVAALEAYQWYIKEYAPEFIDFFKGMADGATADGIELSYAQALAYYSGVRAYPGTEPPGSQDDKLPPKDCSGFAAWGSATKGGKLICASSGDHPVYWWEYLVMVLPETGNSYITRIGGGGHPSMNNRGLSHVHHGAGTDGNEGRGYGVPARIMIQHTLRFANNAEEALAMQLAYPSGIRAAGLWADVSGDAFVLECRDPEVVRRAGDHGEEDFLYATNNALDESLEPFLGGGGGHSAGWPIIYFEHGGFNLDDMNTVRRNLCMWNALHNYHGLVDLDFVEMLWRLPSQAPDYPTLEEAEEDLKLPNYAALWDTHIGNLGNGMVAIMIPDDGDGGLIEICVGPVGRQTEPLTAEWYFYQIAATHTFFELQLASDPATVVNAAKKRSQYDLYYANKELRKLTYADVAYAPLDEIFNQAATESQKGEYYLSLARSTEGNESACNYAKAIRAFTRCQVYANQVYESLVPPADDPTDLGLDEWFGPWGEWETAPDGNPNP